MNNYILSYNPYVTFPNETQLLNHVQVNRYIAQYYQPFIGTFILKSDQTIGVLTESIRGLFDNSPFLLNQLFPHLASGSLPQDAWHWVNYGYIPKPAPPPPPAEGVFSGLLGLANKRDQGS